MSTIFNPILPGFNPDPSILRVGKDFYIATSTFEWFPGVQISRSRDLVHWEVVARPLSRLTQLDMRGNPNSGGIWAPCLTWADGVFYLIYTDVKRWVGDHKDCHNYLATCETIDGEWSDPVYLNSSGFDPSLFHDDDGRKWLVNMIWDHRPRRNNFGGILLQEYDPVKKALVGTVTNIFRGSDIGLVEGPHVYRKDGYYYLLTAEGGTFSTHAITIARSKSLAGPYEVMPGNPLLTASRNPALRLQSAGHGSLVETEDGSWYLAHLARRPLSNGRSILGRETSLQEVVWTDGWPRLRQGGFEPADSIPAPSLPPAPVPALPVRDDFNGPALGLQYQSPRIPFDSFHVNLQERPGWLRLRGRESIVSNFEQTMVARRQQAFHVRARTCVSFDPESFQQMAGLVAFYNTDSFHYLMVTKSDHASRCLSILSSERGSLSWPVEKEYPVDQGDKVWLQVEIDHDKLRFSYSIDGTTWAPVGWQLDASILSDEHVPPCGFTGNFIGLACQDLTGQCRQADFDWFEYEELD